MCSRLTPRKYIGDDLKLDILEKDEITEECKRLWHLYREYIKSFCRFRLKDSPDYVETASRMFSWRCSKPSAPDGDP